VAVINADDSYAGYWRGCRRAPVYAASPSTVPADVVGKVRQHGLETAIDLSAPEGEVHIALRIPGRHNARNAVAAAAACLAAGVPLAAVAAGLESFPASRGACSVVPASKGAEILDDTYNANPDSVRAGIDVLASTIGRKLLVLGDMGEIGEASGQYHDEIGGYAKSQGVDLPVALGDAAKAAVRNFGDGAAISAMSTS
jgi:UDP-N-acetylmuramoyl-tripeptide--D-alanyl-D-alanine ligase